MPFEMQDTRRKIMDILREHGNSTVDTIVSALSDKYDMPITAVTVRHHLNILHKDNLVTSDTFKHRDSPGRPQRLYGLTTQAEEHFPRNYQHLIASLLREMRNSLSETQTNVILEGAATTMAHEARIPKGLTLAERLQYAVEYLNEHGYDATYEPTNDGYVLHTQNCPYHALAKGDEALCQLDLRIVSTMLGVVPKLLTHMVMGDSSCSYLIPNK
ncbi:MAG: BlaI/MecI/CopY family transcriptional regulator [Anaerolineaceae bacterium]|nr:BlaI/MecI/CopY family transcriptional regulator [Anaerolineaceae bacterium]